MGLLLPCAERIMIPDAAADIGERPKRPWLLTYASSGYEHSANKLVLLTMKKSST